MAEKLTVVIVALLGGDALDECVGAVRTLRDNILVVRRDGVILDAEGRTIGRAERLDIPAKRKSAVQLATTPLVALLEDTVVPDRGWAAAVESALGESGVVACGGPVRIAGGLPAQTLAMILSDYGQYSDRRDASEVTALPGCNFAFRRHALLEALRGLDGFLDLPVFSRLTERAGKLVWAPGMAVTFSRPYPQGARLKTCFNHGRLTTSLAAMHSRSGLRRVVAASKALLLPAVLTARTLKRVGPGKLRSPSTFGWLLLQNTAWAAGEFTGAVAGPSRKGLGEWQ